MKYTLQCDNHQRSYRKKGKCSTHSFLFYTHIHLLLLILTIINSKITPTKGFTAKLIPIHYQITAKNNRQSSSYDEQQHDGTLHIEEEIESSNPNHDDEIHHEIKKENEIIVVDGLPFINGGTATPQKNDIDSTPTEDNMTILSALPTLLKLSRPKNFPTSILLHCLSIHLILSNLPNPKPSLLSAFLNPSLLLTISCIILLSGTSMIINDYYDAKNGVDDKSDHYHPLSSGDLPLPLVKRFLSYAYSVLLLGIVGLPGAWTRVSAVIGTMLTYAYTEHLKPRTWIKNVVCAGLIGISPLASGLATLHVYSASTMFDLTALAPLLRMVFILCIGVLSREITMDIVDYQGDKASNIMTIPVRHGKRFATTVCMILSSLNAVFITIPPLLRCISTKNMFRMMQFGMALVAAGILGYDAYKVKVTEGLDDDVSNKAVNHATVAILFFLASFL